MSNWIDFIIIKEGGKTNIWRVVTKKEFEILGLIKWFPSWRQYAFFPCTNTIYAPSCLRDIAEFIEEKMRERRSCRK